MRTICLYFEIHQIIHLKRYRFFDIGTDHYYYDDYANETSINDVAERSYIPALNTLIEMVKNSGGAFKVAFSISGVALEQLEIYAPAVIDLLHQLNDTGCCEFLAEPYSHGLSSLANEDCFKEEVMRQSAKMKQMFGKAPKVFRNSSLIYNDEIGAMVAALGFKGMLTEGAKHVLGWKSPHYVYHCSMNPNLKLLLRDFKLSDDISLRFSNSEWNEYPLFADKYINWIDALPQEEQVINIFMELSALGMAQPLSSNILEFLKALPYCAKEKGITFSTPTEIVTKLKSVSQLDVPYPMSWVDEERDTSCWLGNVMQREAFNKLYSVAERVHLCDDRRIKQDWDYLQASNNFRFMTTKQSGVGLNRGIYESPFDAFTNYMNILGDFIKRVDSLYPVDIDNEELNALLTTIQNQGAEIEELHKELEKAQAKLEKIKAAEKKESKATAKSAAEKPAKAKAPAKKPVAKPELEPFYVYKHPKKLRPGERVPLDIAVWPMGEHYRKGEVLELEVRGVKIVPTTFEMGFGRHPIPVPAAGGTYDPLHPPVMEVLGGDVPVPASVSAATVPTPASANHGAHIVHFGGANDSWLQIPILKI